MLNIVAGFLVETFQFPFATALIGIIVMAFGLIFFVFGGVLTIKKYRKKSDDMRIKIRPLDEEEDEE